MDIELVDFLQPLTFTAWEFSQALDNYDRSDPHRRADELDDVSTAPVVNAPLYDTSITNPMKVDKISLLGFPDYSDEVMSYYKMAQMLGKPVPNESIVDLDTAEDYSDFIKNSIKNIIESENEYNIDNASIQDKLRNI